MIRALSYLSASCPAVAENRKKGRMNSPAQRLTNVPALRVVRLAAWNASMMTSAFLYTLSLNAPRNCVQKNGKKRRSRNNDIWFELPIRSPSGKTCRSVECYNESTRFRIQPEKEINHRFDT